MEAHLVGFQGAPGPVQPPGPLVAGADAVLPAEARDKVAARIAHHGNVQRANQLDHVPAEAQGVGGGVVRAVDAVVDGPAQMLDKGAIDPRVHRGHLKRGVQGDFGVGQHERITS